MMRILRPADYRTTAWKNGGGRTTEIFVAPPGAGLHDFDIRLSMADVAEDGLFSVFPGVDRTLAALREGLELTTGDDEPVSLTPDSPPHRFSGDLATRGRLLGGLVLDLNMMTRRDRFSHRMTRIDLVEPHETQGAGALSLGFCAQGSARCQTSAGDVIVSAHECLVLEGERTRAHWRPAPSATLYWIEIAARAQDETSGR